METDSFNKYSARNIICGIFSLIIILSFIAFPKDRLNVAAAPLLKDSRPYKAHIISKLNKKYSSNLNTSRRERIYTNIINEAAKKYEIDAALIKAIIMAESGYNHRAVSKRAQLG